MKLETVNVKGVKFDVYYYDKGDYGYQIDSIEGVTDTQNLREHLAEWVFDEIEKELKRLNYVDAM